MSQAETVPAGGRQVKVPVTTATGCPWTAATDAPWLSITSATAKGTGDLVYTVAPNTGQSERTAVIAVGGRQHTVRQEASAPAELAQPACEYALSQTETVPAVGRQVKVPVTTATGCRVGARHGRAVAQDHLGCREGERRFGLHGGAEHEPVGADRRDRRGRPQHTVRQEACNLTIAPAAATTPANGGAGSIKVAGNCDWSARSDSEWIQITGDAAGAGSRSVAYTVAGTALRLREREPSRSAGKRIGSVNRARLPRPIVATSSTRRPCLRGARRRPGG